MKWKISLLAFAFMVTCLFSTDANARGRLRKIFGQQPEYVAQVEPADDSGWWPWDEEDVIVPTPDEPQPPTPDDPQPDPQPDPEPLPPTPDPVPPAPEPKIPSDPAELNTYVAAELGGYVRANHERSGVTLDIYQARGKQRIVWVTAEGRDWMSALGKAFYLQAVTGASDAGLVLICDGVDEPEEEELPVPDGGPIDGPVDPQPSPGETPVAPIEPLPEPEPLPVPDGADPVDPVPAPEDVPLPEPEVVVDDVNIVAMRHGGDDLVNAELACKRAGLWLVIVHRYGGDVNRVIYNPGAQQ